MSILNRASCWTVAVGGVLLIVLVAGYGALRVWIDAEYVERRLNEAVTRATEGRYRVDIGAVQWSVWRRSMQVDHVALRPGSEAPQSRVAAGNRCALRGQGRIRTARLEGIRLWPLIWHGAVRLDAITLHRPQVHLATRGGDCQEASARESDTAPAGRPDGGVHHRIARLWPDVTVRRFRIERGRVSLQRRGGSVTDSLWGLSVQADNVAVDSSAARDTSRILFARHLDVVINGYRRVLGDSLYALAVDTAQASTRDSSLVATAVRVGPMLPDQAFMRRVGHRTDRYDGAARRLVLRGVDYRRLIEEQAVHVGAARIDSLVINVYRNNHFPPDPTGAPPPMPHEAFRSIPQEVRIDTIHVAGGSVRYTQLPENATEPGQIAFEALSTTIRNVTNDPSRMTPSTPAVVEATAQVAGAGRLHTTIRIPLLARHLNLSYRGRLGPMDARAFNETFVNLAGVRVESGHVDSLRFGATVRRGVAAGTMRGAYQNLEVETLDPATGDRGLGKRIETFALNRVALSSQNTRRDGGLRTGSIQHTHEEGEAFFKFLWLSVRSGLFALVGL